MKYDFQRLNWQEFERLVQGLSRKILGNGTISFGKGRDGGREVTFDGRASYPGPKEEWDGRWIIQAKFKEDLNTDHRKNVSWLLSQLDSELVKFKAKKPDNYLLFTNIWLTGVAGTGGRDQVEEACREREAQFGFKHIRVIAHDDITELLDNNRELAITFLPFILPGDILAQLLEMMSPKTGRHIRLSEIFSTFMEMEFKDDLESRLDHAGKLTPEDNINLEKVFIDLEVTDGYLGGRSFKFIKDNIEKGNEFYSRDEKDNKRKFVLIAGPGYGKSTLVQYLSQIYRAFFLVDKDKPDGLTPEVLHFIKDFDTQVKVRPKWVRFPVKIVIKEYAGWIRDNQEQNKHADVSVMAYVRSQIAKKATAPDLTSEELESFFRSMPCLFVFDGLDEVPVSSNRDIVIAALNSFSDTILRRFSTDFIVIATTRPQGYSREFDPSRYEHLYIADLDKPECELYLGRLLSNIISDSSTREEKYSILVKLLNDPDMFRLMRSPLQVSIMAILVKSGGEPPKNKFDLFTDYFNTIFNREKQRNISAILQRDPKYVKDIHYYLGAYLQAVSEKNTNPSATISLNEFKMIIGNYLGSMGLESHELEQNTKGMLEVAMQRLVFISELEAEKYGFAIRSLQEYFAAIGFIRNVDDPEDRFKRIATNAYWNNTLLFIVGFLAEHNTKLLPFIESLCAELNGSSDEPDTKSLPALSKFGSWVALDVLAEGTFHSNRNLENKFSHFLRALFDLPYIPRHADMIKLPQLVIKTWLVKFLRVAFEENDCHPTAWRVVALFYNQSSDVKKLLSDCFPKEPIKQFSVLKIFVEKGITDEFVMNGLQKLLISGLSHNWLMLLKNRTSQKLLLKPLSESDLSKSQKRILFEVVFLLYLDNGIYEQLPFRYFNIPLASSYNTGFSPLVSQWELIKIDISGNYGYTIIKTKLNGFVGINALLSTAEEVDSKFVSSLLNFLKTLSYKYHSELFSFLGHADDAFRIDIENVLRRLNSFFRLTHQARPSDLKSFERALSAIETISGADVNRTALTKLHNKKFACIKHLRGSQQLATCHEFIDRYLKRTLVPEALNEFRIMFLWAMPKFSHSDILSIRSDLEILGYYIKSLDTYNELLSPFLRGTLVRFLLSLGFLKRKEMLTLLSRPLSFQNEPLNFDFHFDQAELTLSATIVEDIAHVVRVQLLTTDGPCYKLLFQAIIAARGFTPDKIPFSEILKHDEFNDPFQGLLLTLDPWFEEAHYQAVSKIFGALRGSDLGTEMRDSILFVMRLISNNEYGDKLLVLLDRLFTGFDDEFDSEFTHTAYQYIGSKPTGINPQQLVTFN